MQMLNVPTSSLASQLLQDSALPAPSREHRKPL
ncbi:hypothetical protein PS928_01920 [Pseudomonas fluorescens]|uniref:Uncharacterized protein n=1 Tax=Pseudomonas fluorescens TaxID=294 RepID=A0A5E7T4F5_PSEFL|nr:hypothetical protein PS928_01920 [Pseudomonas fluorescens]